MLRANDIRALNGVTAEKDWLQTFGVRKPVVLREEGDMVPSSIQRYHSCPRRYRI